MVGGESRIRGIYATCVFPLVSAKQARMAMQMQDSVRPVERRIGRNNNDVIMKDSPTEI